MTQGIYSTAGIFVPPVVEYWKRDALSGTSSCSITVFLFPTKWKQTCSLDLLTLLLLPRTFETNGWTNIFVPTLMTRILKWRIRTAAKIIASALTFPGGRTSSCAFLEQINSFILNCILILKEKVFFLYRLSQVYQAISCFMRSTFSHAAQF